MMTSEELKRCWATGLDHPITPLNQAPWQISDIKFELHKAKVWIRGEGSCWMRFDQCFIHEDRDEVLEYLRMKGYLKEEEITSEAKASTHV